MSDASLSFTEGPLFRRLLAFALPLMAAGFLFLPMHELGTSSAPPCTSSATQYFYIVLWALWPVLASRGSVPTGWVVGWGLLCIQLGQFVGSVAAAIALTFVQSDLGLAMVSAGVIFAILIIALFAMEAARRTRAGAS